MSDVDLVVRKLPVWRTAKASYQVIFHNPLLAVKLAIIPLIFVGSQTILFSYLYGGKTATELAADMTGDLGFFILVFGVAPIVYLSTIPMITAWHRMVILGHSDKDSRIHYSIQRNEWSYLWKVILFGLLIALIYILVLLALTVFGIIFAAITSSGPQGTSIVTIFVILAISLVLLVMCGFVLRFSLVFPAAAIGKPIGFRESWRKSRGNTWRLFAAVCFGFLPSAIIINVAHGLLFGVWAWSGDSTIMPTMSNQILMSPINISFGFLGLCVGVSVWSWSYRYLIQGEPITLPDEQASSVTTP